MKLKNIFRCAVAAVGVAACAMPNAYAIESDAFKYVPFGDVAASAQICTNMPEVMSAVATEINEKQDKFILGKNLERGSTVFKIVPEEVDTLGGTNKFPFLPAVYSTGTNFMDQISLYDYKTQPIDKVDQTKNLVGAQLTHDENDQLVLYFRYNDQDAYVGIKSIEPVDKLIIDVKLDDPVTYGYSHPYDWRVTWKALTDTSESIETSSSVGTSKVGQVYHVYDTYTVTGSKVQLGSEYMDEVNTPNFNVNKYRVDSGPATIDGSVLTATDSGVVNVSAIADNGDTRSTPVSIYQYSKTTSYANWSTDLLPARRRINDYHLNMLQKYRSNPTTNRTYSTWNSPTSTKHVGYKGDQFTGQYGKHFFPYQHISSSSGSTGFWSTHGPISKHVMLVANHYGDWNHGRAKGMTLYLNYDGKFSGKTAIKLLEYVNLNTWAKENGFTGTDAACGDVGVYLCRTLDDENVGIPDECLPYLATPDYLNKTYGYSPTCKVTWSPMFNNMTETAIGVPGIALNQAATVSLRCINGVTWSSWSNPFREGTIDTSDDPVVGYFRTDIGKLARLCGWHSTVIGDSGQPVYLYDPALTTGLTYDFGEGDGPEPLLRPILLASHTTAGGGTSVGKCLKVIKAYCESVGDTLDYVLGDIENDSNDTEVITANAEAALEDLKFDNQ